MDALDPAAIGQIEAVVDLVRDVLGDDVEAVYLFGSAVRGGLRPDSDLDLLGVAARDLTDVERRALIRGCLAISRSRERLAARHIELTIVTRTDIRPWRYPPPMAFQYGDWWRANYERGVVAPWTSPNPDLAVVLTAVRAEGHALVGPSPTETLEVVPREDLTRALRDVIPDLMADLEDDTRNVLLTLARVWFTLETGAIEPKDLAADWAIGRLPADRGEALRRARDAYRGTSADDWTVPGAMAQARAAAAAMLEAIRA